MTLCETVDLHVWLFPLSNIFWNSFEFDFPPILIIIIYKHMEAAIFMISKFNPNRISIPVTFFFHLP